MRRGLEVENEWRSTTAPPVLQSIEVGEMRVYRARQTVKSLALRR